MKWNCDLCGSDGITLPQHPDYSVCSNCGFIFVPERRSMAQIAKAWDGLWGDEYSSDWPMMKARLTYVAEWIDFNIGLGGKSLLDIGAGEGEFLRICRAKEVTPSGVEPYHKNVVDIRRAGFECFQGSLEDVETTKRWDIVTILWTLENTGDCMSFLRRAKSLLKPDGHLVVATGSRILVPFKKSLAKYLPGPNAACDQPDLHCFRFSRNGLIHALARAGFKEATNNRFEDSDWLVISATGTADPDADHSVWYDNPQAVLNHFDRWQETWP